jgi:predicted Zn-dependent protease
MKSRFFELADGLCRTVRDGEILLCHLSAERSDFVRFNRSRVRQAGTVVQQYLTLKLVSAQRQASATVALAGNAEDFERARSALDPIRDVLSQLPRDPWLAIAESPQSTFTERRGNLPQAEAVALQVTHSARDVDLVGFYGAGSIYRGFANSAGQHNWHEVETFNLDYSLHLQADRAIKDGYAGRQWDTAAFEARLARSTAQLEILQRDPVVLEPGEYRTYLTPRALEELTGLLQWDGFSARARATRQSPLLRMEHGERLSPLVSLAENLEAGIGARFQQDGFLKPSSVTLIDRGALGASLVSPRSAREYGLETNGANARESPESLDLAAGELDAAEILEALDTGLYVGNLWYLNYSDRPAGRITGMTRFGTFWVERGRIVAPVKPLRFDDTVYRMLGGSLVGLTRERELLLSTSTYEERSTASTLLPGALIDSLRFTL